MAPASSPSPSKKLLITDPKSKSIPKPDLNPSFAATSPDQPNLSDCHCCSNRIDQTNPKDRLQLLDSIWRIVLVCRDCRRAIRLGRKCPYCFKATSNSGNLFQCGACRRKIHQDCVGDFGNWFNFVDEGSRVCLDCWVPEYLKKSFRVCDGSDSDEDDCKDKGKHRAEKLGSVKERPPAPRLCRNGVDLSNVVLALPVMGFKFSGSIGAEKSNATAENSVLAAEDMKLNSILDNAELAGSCSSPRTFKSVLSIKDWNGLTYKRHGSGRICRTSLWSDANSGLLPYKRDKKRKTWQLVDDVNLSEPMSRLEMKTSLNQDDQNHLPPKANRFMKEFVGYNRSRFKKCKSNGDDIAVSRGEDEEEVLATGTSNGEGDVSKGGSIRDPDPFRFKYARRSTKGMENSDLHRVSFLSNIEALFQESTGKEA